MDWSEKTKNLKKHYHMPPDMGRNWKLEGPPESLLSETLFKEN